MRWLALLPLLVACSADPPAPWQEGELLIEQIDLPASAIGEAALVIGPDGTSVLIDVGNDSHDDEVRAALERHLGAARVDWVVLTHYHADHIGGFDDLVVPEEGDDAVAIAGGLVWRGRVELAEGGANRGEFTQVCEWTEQHPEQTVALCVADEPAPCDPTGAGPWPAAHCDGLPWTIVLGDGASLTLFGANGHTLDGDAVQQGDEPGERRDDPGENARSLIGTVRYGDFTYVFAGDLTGGGKDTPDVESFVAQHAAAWPAHPVPAGGVDVIQLSHHGISSSTTDPWVDWLLPDDGRTRHAVVGSNAAYPASPAQSVLDRIGARLGEGSIWVTRKGGLAGQHERLEIVRGAVSIRVGEGGGAYTVEAGEAVREFEATSTGL